MVKFEVSRRCYRRGYKHLGTENRLESRSEQASSSDPYHVLIKVHAVSLNFRDANMLHGTNPWPVLQGGVLCSDAAGEVIAVGTAVTLVQIGDRVSPILDQASISGREQHRAWLGGEIDGVLADHIVFREDKLVKIPEHLSWAEASCLPNAGLTAWSGLGGAQGLRPGLTILIQGTGGVSMMALKIARGAGCKVILSSSSDEKLKKIRDAYEDPPLLTFNYAANKDWHEQVLKLTAGEGVDVVIENGGTSSLLESMKSTKRGGAVSQIGYLGKQDAQQLDGLIPLLIDRKINLRGINVGSKHAFEDLLSAVAATRMGFADVIDRTFPFEQAAEAIEYVWSGRQVGKVVVEL